MTISRELLGVKENKNENDFIREVFQKDEVVRRKENKGVKSVKKGGVKAGNVVETVSSSGGKANKISKKKNDGDDKNDKNDSNDDNKNKNTNNKSKNEMNRNNKNNDNKNNTNINNSTQKNDPQNALGYEYDPPIPLPIFSSPPHTGQNPPSIPMGKISTLDDEMKNFKI